jgi:hypothetical protein
MIFFQFVFVFSTIVNGNINNIKNQIIQAISIISICFLTEIEIQNEPERYFGIMSLVVGIMTFIHIYTMFKYYPVGMYIDDLGHTDYYFLGYDNASFFDVFPLVLYNTMYIYYKRGEKSPFIYIIPLIVGIAYFYVKSTTSMIMMMIYILFLLLHKNKIFQKIFNIKNVIYFIIFSFVFIVILNGQEYFADFLQNTLNKSVTLNGRTKIWKNAFYYIFKSPILGYGLEDTSILIYKFGINHVHNFILDILYKGGIVALFFYVCILRKCINELYKHKADFLAQTITMGIFIYLLAGTFDYYNNRYIIFTFYILAVHVSKIIELHNTKQSKL